MQPKRITVRGVSHIYVLSPEVPRAISSPLNVNPCRHPNQLLLFSLHPTYSFLSFRDHAMPSPYPDLPYPAPIPVVCKSSTPPNPKPQRRRQVRWRGRGVCVCAVCMSRSLMGNDLAISTVSGTNFLPRPLPDTSGETGIR